MNCAGFLFTTSIYKSNCFPGYIVLLVVFELPDQITPVGLTLTGKKLMNYNVQFHPDSKPFARVKALKLDRNGTSASPSSSTLA